MTMSWREERKQGLKNDVGEETLRDFGDGEMEGEMKTGNVE